jgi:ribosomal-protein-serine acetyltransferase
MITNHSSALAAITLVGGTVNLRPWRPGDEPELFEAARESLPTVGRWLPWLTESYSPADSAAWITSSVEAWEAGVEFRFAVVEATPPGRLLGGVGINQLNKLHRMANLGYWVRTTATGQGVATHAARLAARFALTTLELVRVEIVTMDENAASQRVAVKLGATFEGVLRDRLWLGGKSHPARLYSIVRGDLPGW